MDISKSVTNNVVYNAENPAQSMLSQLDSALTFKIIQNYRRRKLIVYFNIWGSLDKPKNKPPKKTDSIQKQNQKKTPNVTQKVDNHNDRQLKKGKFFEKKKQSTSNNKNFDGNDKLTILAEIQVLLRSLAN
ncbi:uncharacterized protein OCT59_020796 [Rhizophagus irregularis]|uniref:uncharacterized protein n=1 Tax=Rhizophagus irregularis TaxID=588596 RepID=UPI0033326AB8|nr:hypothetical protein OCT59_020796 [Rhizophagus irregularis]